MGENTFWDDLGRMLAEIDYMMHKAVGKVRQKAGMYRYPHAHIKEKENEIIIEVELPGMRKEDIEINSDEYGVEIKAEKKEARMNIQNSRATAGFTEELRFLQKQTITG